MFQEGRGGAHERQPRTKPEPEKTPGEVAHAEPNARKIWKEAKRRRNRPEEGDTGARHPKTTAGRRNRPGEAKRTPGTRADRHRTRAGSSLRKAGPTLLGIQ
mmetsp:Transcript_19833/g.49986  ORF Transcript_19833/g.49986 Transcript_19833/m.49986 type:complete len:102 (+) Transcript_19833:156-461(+)